MPSHTKDETKVRPADVTDGDVAGNDFADVLAGEAAKRHIIDINVSTQVCYHTARVNKFQKRFADILTSLPNRPKQPKVNSFIKPKSDKLETSIAASPHSVSHIGGRVSCTQCHNSFSSTDPNALKWLGTPCIPTPFYHMPLRISPVHIGNQNTHSSHHLFSLRGLIFCKKCGFFTQGATLKRLAAPCNSPTAHGIAARNKLQSGSLPAGVLNWPDEKPNSVFTSESLVLTKLSRLLDAEEKKLYIEHILQDYQAPCNLHDLVELPSDADSKGTPFPSPMYPLFRRLI